MAFAPGVGVSRMVLVPLQAHPLFRGEEASALERSQ